MNTAANLPDDIEALKAIILSQQEQNARLEALVSAFRQAMFGRKSEKIDPDQFELALQDIETAIARTEAEGEANPLVTPTQTSNPARPTGHCYPGICHGSRSSSSLRAHSATAVACAI